MRRPLLVFSVSFALLTPACQKKVTKDDCTRMLDHYLDMVIYADPATRNLEESQAVLVRETKRDERKLTKRYAQVETQCEREITRSEYDCTVNAHIPDEWEACIE